MRPSITLALSLLLAVGCKPAEETADTGPETEVVDTDTGVVHEYGFHGYTQIPEGAERPTSVKIGLVFLVQVDGDGILDPGATLASTELSGTGVFRVDLEAAGPPQEQRWPRDPVAWPLHRTATYFPVAFDDLDDDGILAEGEPIVGVHTSRWLMWLEGKGPDDWPTGWTIINPHLDQPGADPTFYGISAEAEIHLRGLINEEITIGGTWSGTAPHADLGIAGIDYHWVTEGEGHTYAVFDEPLADGEFEDTIDRQAPVDHFFEHPDLGLRYAIEAPLVYQDADASASWETTETLTGGTACHEGAPVLIRYMEPPIFMDQAMALEANEWSAGWRAFTGYDGTSLGAELTAAQAAALTVDPESCTLAR